MKRQKGFAAIFVVIMVLSIFIIISMSLFITTLSQQVIANNNIRSSQSYYAAEAGIEDALLKLLKDPSFLGSYELTIDNKSSQVQINPIGTSREILSTGNVAGRIRKLEIIYSIATDRFSFHYGAHIGNGGIRMTNNTIIRGNVFSNSSIEAYDGGNPEITETVIVAGNNNHISKMVIRGNAYVDICKSPPSSQTTIFGKLHYRTSIIRCVASNGYEEFTEEIKPIEFLISSEKIEEWKLEAEAGGTSAGGVSFSGGTHNLGPKVINGNLSITNNTKLSITGTIHVTGNIEISGGNTEIKLDDSVYGPNGGIIIADGKITIDNSTLSGTSNEKSYLMLISNYESINFTDIAIDLKNKPTVDVLYAPKGVIELANNVELKQISSWGLSLRNFAEIVYEEGLINASFYSGPGGAWEVASWREVE